MKIVLKPYILLLAAVFLAVKCSAQTLEKLVSAGDKSFDDGDYYAASLYYSDAVKKSVDDAGLNYKLAESYRLFNDYVDAAQAYANTVKLDGAGKYPLAEFWYAEMLRSTGIAKNAEAMKAFRKFKNKYHPKDYYSAKAQQDMEACSWAIDHKDKASDSIKIEHLGKDVNTEHSEFNAIEVYPGKMQYSALRNIGDGKRHQQYLVRLYNKPDKPDKIFMPAGADSSLHIGNGAYSPDAKRFYFTQCEQKDKTNTRCDIYMSCLQGSGWAPAVKLPVVNDPTATNTHPAVGVNSKGNEVLFFVSDRAGGQGNLDIWYSNINSDGGYSVPVNMGKSINTPGNEVTPFYDVADKKLYFSSDWHYGFGGYDIFVTAGEGSAWSTPQNLLQPVNTPQNDLYYSLNYDGSKSYLTSNRVGSYFIEAQTCCNDIYAYNTGKTNGRKIDTLTTATVDTPPKPVTMRMDTPVPAPVHVDTAPLTSLPVPAVMPAKAPPVSLATIRKVMPVLYFDNDQPDCCNMNDTTKLDYKQTYEAYAGRMYEYGRQFSKGLKGDAKATAQKDIDSLFNKVDKGFYNLVAFSSQLLDMLKAGNKMEVTIKGYCSPLNFSQYNIKLGFRRVASLKNYFYHYRDGALMPYITNGELRLKSVSFGKETAPKGISDNRLDQRNSVYNPAAALERRVEVISVDLQK
jgi:WD40-like Beta Propeller Repeat